jgi:hypothetical protein
MELITQTEQLLSGLTGKLQVKALEEAFTFQIEEGYTNPLEFTIRAKMLMEALNTTIDKTKDLAMTEQSRYGKTANIYGAEVTQVESGIKVDYSVCNDPEYQILQEEYEIARKNLMERQIFLRSIKEPMTIVTRDGEVVTINPPIKSSTTTLRVKLSK